MDSFAAAIGNIVYDKSRRRQRPRQAGVLGAWTCSATCLPASSLPPTLPVPALHGGLDGPRLAAALSFVLVFCLNEYVGWNHRMLGSYRAVLGHFRGRTSGSHGCSAAVNLSSASSCSRRSTSPARCGATVVAHCIMGAGVGGGVPSVHGGQDGPYLGMQALHWSRWRWPWVAAAVCAHMPGGWLGLVPRVLVVLVVLTYLTWPFTAGAEMPLICAAQKLT